MKRQTWIDLGVFSLLVSVGVATRWITGEFEGLSNFTAVGAAALFGGFYFRNRLAAMLLPLAIVLISDLALQQHNTAFGMTIVYVAWLVPVALGMLLRGRAKAWRIGSSAIMSSLWFFVFTNFVYWYADPTSFYDRNLTGMMESYIKALPFLRNMLAADLLFSAVCFGAYFACASRASYQSSELRAKAIANP